MNQKGFAHLNAIRFTLIIVEVVWVGMIIQQLIMGNRPWLLIILVPVFALMRFVVFILQE